MRMATAGAPNGTGTGLAQDIRAAAGTDTPFRRYAAWSSDPSRVWSRLHARCGQPHPPRAVRPGPVDLATRVSAAVLACGDGAGLCGPSAAHAWGLSRVAPRPVHVLIPANRRVAPQPGLVPVRGRQATARLVTSPWPPRTSVEHTVLDVGAEGTADEAIAIAALACQRGMTWDAALLTALAARRSHRWRAVLVDALHDIGAGAHSTLEVTFQRDVVRPHGLPRGELQQAAVGPRQHTDVAYPELRLLVELDGLAFHRSTAARLVDTRRDRQGAVRGWTTVRAGWVDARLHPCELAVDLDVVMRRCGWAGTARRCRRPGCAVGRRVAV
jgi:hypothetical protein